MSPLAPVRLYLIATTPPDAGCATWLERVAAAVAGGVDAVQLRAKGCPTDVRRAWLVELAGLGVPLVVNDDVDALVDAGGRRLAVGLHVGREDAAAHAPSGAPPGPAAIAAGLAAIRARVGGDVALGTSTRTRAEVDAAFAAGADHVGFGAMFPTTTKRDTTPADLDVLAACAARAPGPVFPIGGVGPSGIATLAARGVRRAAVGSAILDAADPRAAAIACRNALTIG